MLTNARQDHYHSVELDARRSFANGYTIFASYTRSSARTNAALDYLPTPSPLGAQQSGPLAWDTPNRVVSWGWMPLMLPKFKKSWDFVYTVDWRTGFPFTSVNANRQVVGAAGSQRFPDYLSFSPGLEWRFHFRGATFGLRGVLENATNRANPALVNNVVDSPQYGAFQWTPGQGLHHAHPADRGEVERGRMPLDEVHTSLYRFRSGRLGFRREYVCALGGPDRDRTGDLFHAMEARSQLRHRPTLGKDIFYSQGCGPLSQTSFDSPRHDSRDLASTLGRNPAQTCSSSATPPLDLRTNGNYFPALWCLSQ